MPDFLTDELYFEAADIAQKNLADHDILDALYLTYDHYRQQFLEERGLMDAAPGQGEAWAGALRDARRLERHVEQTWREKLISSIGEIG